MASNMSSDATLSNNGDADMMKSEDTSPAESRNDISTRTRSDSETTLTSSTHDDSRTVSTTDARPNVPANTPAGGSIAGDGVNAADTRFMLHLHKELTPDSAAASERNANHVNGNGQNGGQAGQRDLETVMVMAVREGVPEETTWGREAEEMAALGLKRLVQLAKDENAKDPSKSIKEFYSQYLSKAIKEAEVQFDTLALS